MIAILVAVKQELNPILRRANAPHIIRQDHLDFYEGTLAGQPVALLALGVGKECARIAAEVTVKCYRPDLVISAGFGGGLREDLGGGDIIIGTDVLDLYADDGKNVRWRSTQELHQQPRLAAITGNFKIQSGKILTADEMVLKAATKARIGKATGALTVDMETSSVAAVAAAHETEFLAVRAITDTAKENLPEEFNDFFVVGQLQPTRIIAACARRPRLVLDLARLGYRANQAGDSLARFLEQAVTQLGPILPK
jgi:5'-methylthioadenosine/S-adenosylhomocysteine nucleosidase